MKNVTKSHVYTYVNMCKKKAKDSVVDKYKEKMIPLIEKAVTESLKRDKQLLALSFVYSSLLDGLTKAEMLVIDNEGKAGFSPDFHITSDETRYNFLMESFTSGKFYNQESSIFLAMTKQLLRAKKPTPLAFHDLLVKHISDYIFDKDSHYYIDSKLKNLSMFGNDLANLAKLYFDDYYAVSNNYDKLHTTMQYCLHARNCLAILGELGYDLSWFEKQGQEKDSLDSFDKGALFACGKNTPD